MKFFRAIGSKIKNASKKIEKIRSVRGWKIGIKISTPWSEKPEDKTFFHKKKERK